MNAREHEAWMLKAITLAEKGRFSVSPNPMVGAFIVKKGRVIAKGYHQQYGGHHAEVDALKRAGKKAKGATLYVTLEPCATFGKTPPCVDAVIQAGIKRVVIGSQDPTRQNRSKGIRTLKKAGIAVTLGVLSRETQKQNEAFFKWAKTGLPFVTLKMAQSLDGKIATRTGSSRWITSPDSRQFVHRLRYEQDAILVGKNTFQADNPQLSPRLKAQKGFGKPWRIAIVSSLNVSSKARIFKGKELSFFAISEKKLNKKKTLRKGMNIISVREKKGRLDLMDLLKKLGSLGVAKLLVEGGGELAWSFLEKGFVDKAYWIIAPKMIGGREAITSVEGEGFSDPNHALNCQVTRVSQMGRDWLFEGEFH